MEILLSITGLFIAIIALPWFRRPIERIYQKIKERFLIRRAPQGTLPALNLVALAVTFTKVKENTPPEYLPREIVKRYLSGALMA